MNKKKLFWTIAMMVALLVSACGGGGPLTPAAPVATKSSEQIAAEFSATAQAEKIARCNDLAANHANEVIAIVAPELYVTRDLRLREKTATMDLSLILVESECGSDYEFRAVFSMVGENFYPDFKGNPNGLLSRIVFRFKYSDGTYKDFQFVAANNMIIARINNLVGASMIVEIFPIMGTDQMLDLPKVQVAVINPAHGSFGESIGIEYMGALDWWRTPTQTPGGCTFDPLTTPLPLCPTSTPRFGWLDSILGTPQPLPSVTPTPSITTTPSNTPVPPP